MAIKNVQVIYDDVSGGVLTIDQVVHVEVTFKGTTYMIDTSEENADKITEKLESIIQYASHSEEVETIPPVILRAIRQWAKQQGLTVPERGSLSQDIIDSFTEAYGAHVGMRRPHTKEIRQWAKEQGFKLNERGRIPSEVIEAYNAR